MKPALVTFLAVLTLAACGDDSTQGDGASAPETEAATEAQGSPAKKPANEKPKPKPRPGTEVKISSSQYGDILYDGGNQAVYLFDKESSSEPACYGDCATAWPPVLTDGKPRAGSGVDDKLLGTTQRDDGSVQLTYNGHPLYYYAHEGPNEVLCHNVEEFGGLWLVLDAAGNALA